MDVKLNTAAKLINSYAKDRSKEARRAMKVARKTAVRTYEKVRGALSDGGRVMFQDRRRMMMVGGIALSATALGIVLTRAIKKKS